MMSANVEKRDIRSIKTEKALVSAMFSLLKNRNFNKITVRNISEDAQISRAAFYAHFTDKYDFLKWWIKNVWPDNMNDIYEAKETKINNFVDENKRLIKNIFMDADRWTIDALFDALHFILNLTVDKTIEGLTNPKYIVLSNFYIGGMIQYISWQVRNDFPQNVTTMNNYLYEVIKTFQEW